MKRVAIVLLLSVIATPVFGKSSIPEGWRIPGEADYTLDWKEFRSTNPTPFHVSADFNGDNVSDDAYILLSTHSKAWGLFVILNTHNGKSAIIKLDENDGQTPPQSMGLSIAKPGDYVTACGKGYFDCDPGDPESLHLGLPALEYSLFESAKSFFWWDKQSKNFHRTWISD
jgi:hypothetical protein